MQHNITKVKVNLQLDEETEYFATVDLSLSLMPLVALPVVAILGADMFANICYADDKKNN